MGSRKVPEIRFKGFHDDWVQRKLEDIIDIQSGRDYKHLNSGVIPVYGTGGYMLSVDKALSYSDDAIGIGRKGTIDKPYILHAPFWTVDTLFYALVKGENKLPFLFCIFQCINWKKRDESTGVPSLSRKMINSVKVMIANPDEQQMIGDLFNLFDNLIALYQRKIEILKEMKRKKYIQKECFRNVDLQYQVFVLVVLLNLGNNVSYLSCS